MINLVLPASGCAGFTTQIVFLTVLRRYSFHSQLGSRRKEVQGKENSETELGQANLVVLEVFQGSQCFGGFATKDWDKIVNHFLFL